MKGGKEELEPDTENLNCPIYKGWVLFCPVARDHFLAKGPEARQAKGLSQGLGPGVQVSTSCSS